MVTISMYKCMARRRAMEKCEAHRRRAELKDIASRHMMKDIAAKEKVVIEVRS